MSSSQTTSHARAVAPVLLSPLERAYFGRRHASAVVEQADLGEEKREGGARGGDSDTASDTEANQ